MFSLQPNDELVFGTPTTTYNQVCDIQLEDLAMDQDLTQPNFINFSTDDKRVNSGAGSTPKNDGKKVVHRDTERKRRREMSNLHLTLASLLPIQQKKGKRAVCDQMEEATNYIKNMENRMKELRMRREKLTKLCAESCSPSDHVTINLINPDGMEILIKSSGDEYYGILPALKELEQRELDVVNCVSNRLTTGFLHKIHIQGCRNMKSLDVTELQHKLSNTMACMK